jgi:hypothetical protein
MRTLMRAALVAVAVMIAVPAMPVVLAQASTVSWTVVPVKELPRRVATAQKKAFPKAKITKVEQSGTGATVIYRVTMTGGKKPEAKYNAAGKMLK